jgi:hypothetical protein
MTPVPTDWVIDLDRISTQTHGPCRMFRSFKKRPEDLAALDRVKEWTRERFKLADDAAILVSQIACALPGCPPLETVVAFWTEGDRRHQFKLFKSVADVVPDDLPPTWMKNALVAIDGMDCDCC